MPAIEFTAQAIGRTTCSDCGWEHAEVRENKVGRLWYYCGSCKTQHQTRDAKGSNGLRSHMLPLLADPEASDVTKPKPKPKGNEHHNPLPPRRTKAAHKSAPKNGRETPTNDRSEGNPGNDRDPRTKDFWNDDFLGLGKLAK